MRRRPDPALLQRSLAEIVLAAVVIGPEGWLPARLLGLTLVPLAVRNWRRYWRAHDEFEALRGRLGR